MDKSYAIRNRRAQHEVTVASWEALADPDFLPEVECAEGEADGLAAGETMATR